MGNKDNKPGTAERMDGMLGFDASKNNPGKTVFDEALKAVTKKRDEANKTKAVELIEKAIGLREKIDAAKKQFEGQEKKFNKELGKLLSSIEAMAKGTTPAPTEEE
jgi:hypothetical protein